MFLYYRALCRCAALETLQVSAQHSLAAICAGLPLLKHLILDEPPRSSEFKLPAGFALPVGLRKLSLRLRGTNRELPHQYVLLMAEACRGLEELQAFTVWVEQDLHIRYSSALPGYSRVRGEQSGIVGFFHTVG